MVNPDPPDEPDELVEPEFSEARVAEMQDLSSRARLVDEDGAAS